MEALGEVPVLVDMWEAAGFPYSTNASWFAELLEKETSASFIEADNFLAIWHGYFERFAELQESEFTKATQGSGVATEQDLPAIFHELGVWAMPGAIIEAERMSVPPSHVGKGLKL